MTIETFLDGRVSMHIGDVREKLRAMPADHFDCVVTSPPYWGLRDYGTATWVGGDPDCDHRSPTMRDGRNEDRRQIAGSTATNTYQLLLAHRSGCGKCGAVKVDQQIGLEPTLGEHLAVMVDVFEEVRRVLKPTGTLWLNYGDCYATAPNGRSAVDIKALGNDDRTFRDKPFSTIGAIYDPEGGAKGKGGGPGKHRYKDDESPRPGRVVAGGYLKSKDLCMIPNRLAIALQDAGWWVRSEIIWHKPNPMPESTRDRPTTSHEKIWLCTKSERYFYDADAIAEPCGPDTVARSERGRSYDHKYADGGPGNQTIARKSPSAGRAAGNKNHKYVAAYEGDEAETHRTKAGLLKIADTVYTTRNARNVWTIGTAAFSEAHFATFPPEIPERCIKAGCPAGGTVLDPFGGSGTTALVAAALGRRAELIELNPEYAVLARARIEAAFMGNEEGKRHRVKQIGKLDLDAGPLFATSA